MVFEASVSWMARAAWRSFSKPEGAIEGFDCLSVQILDGLLIAPADAVVGSGIAVESVYCLGDPHL